MTAKLRCLSRLLVSLLFLLPLPALAWSVKPFEAVYQLDSKYALAPRLTIHHQVRQQGEGFLTRMEADIQLASWREQSHFINEVLPVALEFQSRQRLIRSRQSRQLSFESRAEDVYDRQTALLLLSALAERDGAASEGILAILSPRGRDVELAYQVRDFTEMSGMQAAVIDLWLQDKPEQRARVYLSMEVPGLILQAEAFDEKGLQLGKLRLRSWALAG